MANVISIHFNLDMIQIFLFHPNNINVNFCIYESLLGANLKICVHYVHFLFLTEFFIQCQCPSQVRYPVSGQGLQNKKRNHSKKEVI